MMGNKIVVQKVIKGILRRIILYSLMGAMCIYLLEAKAVFHPSKGLAATPKEIGLEYEDVTMMSYDNIALNGWFIKAPQAGVTLLFFHGNAGTNADRLEKIAYFYKMGLNVFIVDYRGFGKSEGNPTEKNVNKDALTIYDYLAARKNIFPKTIIVYGESLGGAVAVELATKRDVAGLILDSTFTSAKDIAKLKFPFIPSFLIQTKMDSLSKMTKIRCPKMIIHSMDDELIPFRMGQALYAAALPPKNFLEIKGSHNEGYYQSRAMFNHGIIKFLTELQWVKPY